MAKKKPKKWGRCTDCLAPREKNGMCDSCKAHLKAVKKLRAAQDKAQSEAGRREAIHRARCGSLNSVLRK